MKISNDILMDFLVEGLSGKECFDIGIELIRQSSGLLEATTVLMEEMTDNDVFNIIESELDNMSIIEIFKVEAYIEGLKNETT